MTKWLIYADGRVEQTDADLSAARMIQTRLEPDGSCWQREFRVDFASVPDPKNPERELRHTRVGLECADRMTYTADEYAKWQHEFYSKLRSQQLNAIMGSPQSGKDPDE